MSFDVVNHTMSAAVASAGTFTVSYPAGKSSGTYSGAHKHKLVAMQSVYTSPEDFTLSFGASSITVTWNGTTSLPANEAIRLQLDKLGLDSGDLDKVAVNERIIPTSVQLLDLGSPATADADGVAASQSVAAAASFSLDGALVTNGVAIFDTPRNVVAAWTTASVLTITGTDVDGNTIVEASASGTSHTGSKAFKTVTSVSSSASITSATVGTGNKIGLPVHISDASFVVAELMDGVALPKPAGKIFIPWELEQTELLAPTNEQIVSPVAGYISKILGTVQDAVTTGGAVTVKIGTTDVTGLTFTVADSDAAGTRYSDAPTTRHGADSLVAAGDRIQICPASAFATAGSLNGVLEIDVTAAGQLDGTLVAGVTSAATATTGDTRGTYTPAITPDGTHAYALVAVVPDPTDQGVTQYAG